MKKQERYNTSWPLVSGIEGGKAPGVITKTPNTPQERLIRREDLRTALVILLGRGLGGGSLATAVLQRADGGPERGETHPESRAEG